MKKQTLIIIFLTYFKIGFSLALNNESGGLAGEYLNSFSVSAKAFAMGKANIAVADDVYGPYWNPSGLSLLQYSEAGFTLVSFAGTRYNFIGYAAPLDLMNAVSISRFAFDSPLAEKTNSLGESLGYY